ncbi:MAG: glycosyltransferase family 2 protein [Geminicoccaceae bacterium]
MSPSPLLITCVGVDFDLDLFPHFLRHYLTLGVERERVLTILNSQDEKSSNLALAEAMLADHGMTPADVWIAPYTSDSMWARRRALQEHHATRADWVLSADVDEFHEYPEPLADFLGRCDAMNVNVAHGVFIDRLAPDGRLEPVRPEPDLMRQFPVQADVIWSLAGRGTHHDRWGTVKLMAFRGHIFPGRGGHGAPPGQPALNLYAMPLGDFPGVEQPGFRFRVPTRVHHFHWTAKLPGMLRRRLATPGVSAAGREYGRKQLDHIERHDGIDLTAVAIAPPLAGQNWSYRLRRMRLEGRFRRAIAPAGRVVRSLFRRSRP